VQVKNYEQEIGAEVEGQLRMAHDHYGREGMVLALVVMTTAERASAKLIGRMRALEDELKVSVKVALRNEMMKLFPEGLMAGRRLIYNWK
jgi:hypothetical protein